jgi:hypothetical protein
MDNLGKNAGDRGHNTILLIVTLNGVKKSNMFHLHRGIGEGRGICLEGK